MRSQEYGGVVYRKNGFAPKRNLSSAPSTSIFICLEEALHRQRPAHPSSWPIRRLPASEMYPVEFPHLFHPQPPGAVPGPRFNDGDVLASGSSEGGISNNGGSEVVRTSLLFLGRR